MLLGLAIMVVSEAATLARIEPFYSWNTPIAWSGFILFADAVVYRRRGRSWLHSARREFVCLALLSIPLWLVFEFFNLYIENWHYVGLPENQALRMFGYAWSFATIWPAIFEAADLFALMTRRGRESTLEPEAERSGDRERGWGPATIRNDSRPRAVGLVSVLLGTGMLVWPLVWPSPYLAAPVWLGFIFLLDPINEWLGAESLFRDAREHRYDRLVNLGLSGLLCGVLWEFWNYWAGAKWHYTVPIMSNLKIFEMPVPGYLGFPAFALECFTMYVFIRAVAARAHMPLATPPGYPIGL